MRPNRPVYVVGGANTVFLGRSRPEFAKHGEGRNPTLEQQLQTAVRDAFAVTGVDPAAVDKGYVGNFLGECFAHQGHLGSMLAAVHPALEGKPLARVEAACASGSAAIAGCIDAMQAGCDVTLAAGVEVENTLRSRDGVELMALAGHVEKQRHLDFALFPWMFARRARHYKEATGATDTDIARVVVKAYANANRNPLALNRDIRVSLDDVVTESAHNRLFLEDPDYRAHMKILECTAFTDGASAVVLATDDGLAKLGIDPGDCTQILSYGHTVRALGADTDPVKMHNMADAAAIAWEHAGVGPRDAEVAEVHDCFAISELQVVEALGLADAGEAPALLADGHTDIDGRIPVNAGGGLLGFGHPIGATGVKQAVEIWRQMTGRAGAYQLEKRPRIGVSANLGGDDRTAIVIVHRKGAA